MPDLNRKPAARITDKDARMSEIRRVGQWLVMLRPQLHVHVPYSDGIFIC
jgi:hypothetical protein